jgi:hypothetical protein
MASAVEHQAFMVIAYRDKLSDCLWYVFFVRRFMH